jgi:hypothetical protein
MKSPNFWCPMSNEELMETQRGKELLKAVNEVINILGKLPLGDASTACLEVYAQIWIFYGISPEKMKETLDWFVGEYKIAYEEKINAE